VGLRDCDLRVRKSLGFRYCKFEVGYLLNDIKRLATGLLRVLVEVLAIVRTLTQEQAQV
jgi:hypothetical protein